MRLLRLFSRGIGRTIMRSITRKMISRTRSTGPRQTMRDLDMRNGEIDPLMKEIADQIDVLELLELAAEAPGMISRAKEAAGHGSAMTFVDLMPSFNEGQRVLADTYCIPYAEEYWSTVSEPDSDMYLSGMYFQHEAIEQALGVACEMSYESGRIAGASSLTSDLSEYITEELVVRGFEKAGIRRAQSSWSRFAGWLQNMHFTQYDTYVRATIPEDAMRFRDAKARRMGDFMVIGDKYEGQIYGATRQLDNKSFMGADQPYWFTETRRMDDAVRRGEITEEQYEVKKKELYAKTYNNPYSTRKPYNYKAFDE